MQHHFDVLTVTDCRLPGGTATSTAEEINAQSRTNLRSGLLHIDSPLVSRSRPLNSRLLRHVQLDNVTQVLPFDQVDTDLVVIRHPKVALSIDPLQSPVVRSRECIVVVNQVPTVEGDEIYDLGSVARKVEEWLGVSPRFAPIGPLVRAAVVAHEPHRELEPTDWVNVIDVDEWRSDRNRGCRNPIVVGRHSRDHHIKFPDTRQSLLAAYPVSLDFVVHMLGGRKQVSNVLGSEIPRNWRVHEFDALEPRRFLDELDVYAYFHHPDLIEAFGRNMLEALATGVPIVTHPHFAELFGDAITVCEPDGAEASIRALVSDRPRYLDQIERGRELAERTFGYRTHVSRVENLLGRSVGVRRAERRETSHLSQEETVLFVGPNGSGLGHLTRLMAIARRAPAKWGAHFLTFSTAAATVTEQGFPVTYVPSRSATGSTSIAWHAALAERLDDLIERIQPSAIVIDSTEPYRGLLMSLRNHPEIPVVWSRRGMWKQGVSNAILESGEDFFDLIIEPGDLAFEFDQGATRSSNVARLVDPITFLERSELDGRSEARRFLDVGDDETAILVQLGAGNINDTQEELRAVIEGASHFPSPKIFVTRTPITMSDALSGHPIVTVEHYPLARLMPGFDVAVAAAGYNTFHELLLAGVPTIFVPNTATITDDQERRAHWAAARGVAIVPESANPHEIGLSLKNLAVPENCRAVEANLKNLDWMSGAGTVFELIVELVRTFDASVGSTRRERRQRSFAAVEAAVETKAARKRNRAQARQARRNRRTLSGVMRGFAIRHGRRVKRWALRRLGYQRLLAVYTLLPTSLQKRIERSTRLTPGRATDDPSRLRIPPGRMMDRAQESELVSILFVIGSELDNDSVADAVAHLQTSMRNFKPLFLTSSLRASSFRRYGFAWEHDSPFGSRLERVLYWYRPDFVIEVDETAQISDPDSALQCWLRSRPLP